MHDAAVLFNRLLGRLKQPHNPQASVSIAQGSALFRDRRHELASHETQRFCAFKIWSQHVAVAIACKHLCTTFWIMVLRNPLVVDAHLLAVFHVVIDDHLLASSYQRAADLDGRQPVQMEVRDQIALKLHCHVRNVLIGRSATLTPRKRRVQI